MVPGRAWHPLQVSAHAAPCCSCLCMAHFVNIPRKHFGAVLHSQSMQAAVYTKATELLMQPVSDTVVDDSLLCRTIAPFKEPSSIYWWAGNNQEGCRFDITTQNIISGKLQNMLQEKGLAQVSSPQSLFLCFSLSQLPFQPVQAGLLVPIDDRSRFAKIACLIDGCISPRTIAKQVVMPECLCKMAPLYKCGFEALLCQCRMGSASLHLMRPASTWECCHSRHIHLRLSRRSRSTMCIR